jgi:hypothetical protein
MQDYVTPLTLTAIVVAHLACVASVAAILMARVPEHAGWRLIGPSGTHWFCLLGSWAFGALISWVWLFVGSARRDAEFQMNVALVLAIVFCAGAAWSGFRIAKLRGMALRWRGDAIAWHESGRDHQQAFGAFDAVRRGFDGTFQIRFKDQSVLKLDPYARNVSDFLARFSEEIGSDVY